MKRTISIPLDATKEEREQLFNLQESFFEACNKIVPFAREHRCWNRVALHHLVYNTIRENTPLGSQMVCNAIFAVCKAYKNKLILKDEEVPLIRFHKNRSVHFDKRTYTIKKGWLSLYTLEGRIQLPMRGGSFQESYLKQGIPKEAELIHRKGRWYFNLVLELPDPLPIVKTQFLAVDVGENFLAASSSGKLFGGAKLRHQRDVFLAKRRQLQSNGSQSAKQLLKKISGKEARRVKHVNHQVSKAIIAEAVQQEVGTLVLEDLKNIRKRIQGGTKIRSRLHRWAFWQLQTFLQYKAQQQGIRVLFVKPMYSSQICSSCGQMGSRSGSLFKCLCGSQQHADLNASLNLCRFAQPIGYATCAVNRTHVAVTY